MLNLESLREPAFPVEPAFADMMERGSAMLLRAMRGQPEEAPPQRPPLQFTVRPNKNGPYVPVSQRPRLPAPQAVREIIAKVAEAFDITPERLTGIGRSKHLVMARAVAIRLIRDRTWNGDEPRHSLPTIGRFFGRDHSTICHAIQHFPAYCKAWPEVGEIYERLRDAA